MTARVVIQKGERCRVRSSCSDVKVSFTKIRRSQKLGFIGWDGYSGSALLGLAAKCATLIASAIRGLCTASA